MNAVTIKYIFWVLVSLPMLILGIVLFANITGDIYNRIKEDKSRLKSKTPDDKVPQSLEDSYRRKHSGGK